MFHFSAMQGSTCIQEQSHKTSYSTLHLSLLVVQLKGILVQESVQHYMGILERSSSLHNQMPTQGTLLQQYVRILVRGSAINRRRQRRERCFQLLPLLGSEIHTLGRWLDFPGAFVSVPF